MDPDLFKELRALRYIHLKLRNLKTFLHSRGIEWVHSIYYYLPEIDLDLTTNLDRSYVKNCSLMLEIEVFDDARFSKEFFPFLAYQFEDEDFCVFAAFPDRTHNKLILPVVSGLLTRPSCVTTWLYKYFHVYLGLIGIDIFLSSNLSFLAVFQP
jgi:hypothetical protein